MLATDPPLFLWRVYPIAISFASGNLLPEKECYVKTTGIIIGAVTLGLIAAYSQSKDAASTNRSSALPGRDDAAAVSATPRDTNTSRIYPPDSTNATSRPADNTGRNVRDRSDATLTPGDHSIYGPHGDVGYEFKLQHFIELEKPK